MGNYNSTRLFGSDSEDQEELGQLASAQRPDQAEGRPALDDSEAVAIHQAAREPQVRRNTAQEEALGNIWGDSGVGVQAVVPQFVQQAQAPQNSQNNDLMCPIWDPIDVRVIEIRCMQGTRGILVGDPSQSISYFSAYISAIGENSNVSLTIMIGCERFAWAKNEKGNPVFK